MKINIEPADFSSYTLPRATVLTTANDANGKTNIITLAWHSTLSHKPPLYGISVAYPRHSHHLISGTKEFTVNFLPFDKLEAVHFCGTTSGRRHDKFKETKLTPRPSASIAPPGIEEAYAILECKLVDEVKVGDHAWFVGEVTSVSINKGAFTPVLNEDIGPIFYMGSNIYSNLKGEKKRF